jgi:DNA replication protein DnaC
MMRTAENNDLQDKIVLAADELNLSAFCDYKSIVDPKATFEENLLALLEEQKKVKSLKRTATLLKAAEFPIVKTFDEFELSKEWLPNVNIEELIELRSCQFISEKQDVIFIGPPGHGKTHLALAIGYEAVKAKKKVIFKQGTQMITQMIEAKSEKSLEAYISKIKRADLLILDELGYGSLNGEESELLFRIITSRHEIGSTIITTNYDFSKWPKFIGDPVLANVIADRLVYKSKIFDMNGPKGYRLVKAKENQKARVV